MQKYCIYSFSHVSVCVVWPCCCVSVCCCKKKIQLFYALFFFLYFFLMWPLKKSSQFSPKILGGGWPCNHGNVRVQQNLFFCAECVCVLWSGKEGWQLFLRSALADGHSTVHCDVRWKHLSALDKKQKAGQKRFCETDICLPICSKKQSRNKFCLHLTLNWQIFAQRRRKAWGESSVCN